MIQENDEKVKGYDLDKPHQKQKEVLWHCSQHSNTRVTVVPKSRQSGGSWVCNAALHMMANEAPGLTLFYISYNDWQVNQFFLKFLAGSKDSGLIKSYTGSPGKHSVTYTNGSKIEFKSSLSEVVSATLNAVCIDEFASVSDTFFQQSILPMFATERPDFKSKILLAGSTKGKANHLYKMYLRGLDPAFPDYHSVHFSIFDNPHFSAKNIEIAKGLLSENDFRQEYLGEFVSSNSIIKNIDECAVIPTNQEPVAGVTYFLGCDVGLAKDKSAFLITASKQGTNNQIVQLVSYHTMYKCSAIDIEDFIVALNKKWNFKLILVESNNSGLPIVQSLQTRHRLNNLQGFNTSNTSKNVIINRMVVLFDKKEIEIINKDDLKAELSDYTASLTNTDMLKFGDNRSDDLVMGLAISLEAWSRMKNSGNYSLKVL